MTEIIKYLDEPKDDEGLNFAFTYQMPNRLFDEGIMPLFTGSELLCLSAIFRCITGWKEKRITMEDTIALTRLQNMTGLTRESVVAALEILEQCGFISKIGVTRDGTVWHLNRQADVTILRERYATKKTQDKAKIQEARRVWSVQQTTENDNAAVCPTDRKEASGLSNRPLAVCPTDPQNKDLNQDSSSKFNSSAHPTGAAYGHQNAVPLHATAPTATPAPVLDHGALAEPNPEPDWFDFQNAVGGPDAVGPLVKFFTPASAGSVVAYRPNSGSEAPNVPLGGQNAPTGSVMAHSPIADNSANEGAVQPTLAQSMRGIKPKGSGRSLTGKRQRSDAQVLNDEVAYALADVTGRDASVASTMSRLRKVAKELIESKRVPATAQLVRDHYGEGGWWYTAKPDYTSRKGGQLDLFNITDTWGRWAAIVSRSSTLEVSYDPYGNPIEMPTRRYSAA